MHFFFIFIEYHSRSVSIKSLEGARWHHALRQWEILQCGPLWVQHPLKNMRGLKIDLTLKKPWQCEDVLIKFRSWQNSWTLRLSLWNPPPPMHSVSYFLCSYLTCWTELNHQCNTWHCHFHTDINFSTMWKKHEAVLLLFFFPAGSYIPQQCQWWLCHSLEDVEQHHCPWQHIGRPGTSISSLALSLMIIARGMCACALAHWSYSCTSWCLDKLNTSAMVNHLRTVGIVVQKVTTTQEDTGFNKFYIVVDM